MSVLRISPKKALFPNRLCSEKEYHYTSLGLADGRIHQVSECDNTIAKILLTDLADTWSTMVMRTTPFPVDLLKEVRPHYQVLLSSKPH